MLLVDGLADRLKEKEDFMDKKEIKIVYKSVEELIPYEEIVQIAKDYIEIIGGFEKFAEWGLIR